ncbi:MAG: hypothetical protein EBR82_56230 [Caulobacteraceae bacterium]|nr:hypothetical protein [Caulobacteraceae bacterium]
MKYFTTVIVAALTANLIISDEWQSVVALVCAMTMHTVISVFQKDKSVPKEIESLKSEVERAIGETKKLSLKLGFRQ